MQRFFFNFRQGDDVARDRIGMHLPNLDAARAEGLYAWDRVLDLLAYSGEVAGDCEIQIADSSGETVLNIPFGERVRLH